MTAPTRVQAMARERLLRDAEVCRSEGRAWIADAIVAGATDDLPPVVAEGIAYAPGLAVLEVPREPGWVVAVLDVDGMAVALWTHLADAAEVAQ